MPKHGACNLGSINLSEFVVNPFTEASYFNTEEFVKAVKIAIRALDTVLDENMNNHPLKEQREMAFNYRNVGLGIMGMYDLLVKLGYRYGSKESINTMDEIMDLMFRTAVIASSELAKEKGTYPKYKSCVLSSKIIRNHFTKEELENLGITKYGLRNCSLLSIAPSGTIGTILNISTGCEPAFSISYKRKTESLNNGQDKYYDVYIGVAQEYINLTNSKTLPKEFITAGEINWRDRIDMQSVLQKHIDTAISSTVNLPNECTVEEIEQLYLYAWEKGLKGVTIYRDGCKRSGILTTESKDENKDIKELNKFNELKRGMIIKADDNCIGKKRTLQTGCGTLHCEAFFDPESGELLETYLSKGSSGGCVDCDTEYFNGKEWKKISSYVRDSNEKVLQYNENGFAELVIPNDYIVNENITTLNHFTNSYGLDMVLSDDHRMYLYKNYRKYSSGIRNKLTTEIVTVKEYLNRDGSKERHVPTTFSYKANGIELNDKQIRLLVAIYADGTYDGYKIIISVSKERKKNRLRELLIACDVGWTEKPINNTSYTYFYIHPIPSIKEWFIDKKFTTKWYECNDDQLKVIIDECVHWDGSTGEGNRLGTYYSSKKDEIDFIQFALTRLGYRASISPNNSSNSDKPSYRVRWTNENVHNLASAKIEKYKTKDNRSYCFNVPSGLLVLRRNDKIFITGNCNNYMIGLSRMISLAARGGVNIYSIVDQLQSSGVCPSYAVRSATKHDTSKGTCCPVAVGNALIGMYKEMQEELFDNSDEFEEEKPISVEKVSTEYVPIKNKCPECGEELTFEGGCNVCKNCGYSKCD